MQCRRRARNLVFWPDTYENELAEQGLEEKPPGKTEIIDGFPAVRSQPLANYTVEWDDYMSDVADWMLLLADFKYRRMPPRASSTIVQLDPQVWSLGSLLFTSTDTTSERLGEIRDVLQDSVSDAWQGDPNVQALPDANASVQSLEESLRMRKSAKDLRGDDCWVKAGSK
ncbi:hypothetical protein DFP72DRAFT_852088 [Ephemerocybe angulata]|uniref:Uncharacterized protein n=1 Tax=Ephemerocybe angulata TaxID=980116 RepID=A0A8H6HNY7_9AGAR|nr:hypothetical protein DFP72DRAFT_852088 [Tulosesus angulatus]